MPAEASNVWSFVHRREPQNAPLLVGRDDDDAPGTHEAVEAAHGVRADARRFHRHYHHVHVRMVVLQRAALVVGRAEGVDLWVTDNVRRRNPQASSGVKYLLVARAVSSSHVRSRKAASTARNATN